MVCVPVGASRRLRWGCLSLTAIVALLAIVPDPADARSRRKRHTNRAALASSYNPPYAAIVVDAKSGAVLHQAAPDSPRHPASLTKIMTLYLLFEQLEAGKIKLDTPMEVSEEASIQAPTKLGLKPGDTLKVEDAIKGLVTKSANDASVVIAEALSGGSEDDFARIMTRKARALGMKNTTYRNASGLPNDEQISTARDQALLGIAIQERFPKCYRYFSLASFVYRGRAMRNHNKLLGKVEGVDGIKTGYIRASGFNLVSSVKRGPRHIVAVVLGGRSGGQRDARMRTLIDSHIAEASTKPQAALVAEAPKPEPAPTPVPKHYLAAADNAPMFNPAREATAAIAPGSNAPITPVKVKTVAVKIVPPKASSAGASAAKPEPLRATEPASSPREEALVQSLAAATPVEAPPLAFGPSVLGRLPAMIAAAQEAAVPSAKAEPAKPETVPAAKAEERFPSAPRNAARGGWAVQVGAYEDEGEARQHLSSAKSKASPILQKAEAYIERTVKGAKTYYRARFAGFDRDQAEAVCKRLKRDDIACMALKI